MKARGNVAIGGNPTTNPAVWHIPPRPPNPDLEAAAAARNAQLRRSYELARAAKDARENPRPQPNTPARVKRPARKGPSVAESKWDKLPQDAVVAAFLEGAPIAHLARAHGVRHGVIRRILSENDVDIAAGRAHGRRPRPLPIPLAQLIEEYEAGASITGLGRTHGMHKDAVSRALRRAGVTIRPYSNQHTKEA